MDINAIERVLDKRASRGATDESLIAMLNHLKTIHRLPNNTKALDGLIDAIKQTPLKTAYTEAQMEYIHSVNGEAHQSAVEIIGRLDKALIGKQR